VPLSTGRLLGSSLGNETIHQTNLLIIDPLAEFSDKHFYSDVNKQESLNNAVLEVKMKIKNNLELKHIHMIGAINVFHL